ncbi:UNVERIFIED_CONTAM: hypothetical protein Sindi_0137100 [Sesamum indicum]
MGDQRLVRECYNITVNAKMATPREENSSIDARHEGGEEELRIELSDHKEIQLIDGDLSNITRVGTKLTEEAKKELVTFLRKDADIFAWSPLDFERISPDVVVHRLNVGSDLQIYQVHREEFQSERNKFIEQEMSKLLAVGYMAEVQYTNWLSNMEMVPKGGGSGGFFSFLRHKNPAAAPPSAADLGVVRRPPPPRPHSQLVDCLFRLLCHRRKAPDAAVSRLPRLPPLFAAWFNPRSRANPFTYRRALAAPLPLPRLKFSVQTLNQNGRNFGA